MGTVLGACAACCCSATAAAAATTCRCAATGARAARPRRGPCDHPAAAAARPLLLAAVEEHCRLLLATHFAVAAVIAILPDNVRGGCKRWRKAMRDETRCSERPLALHSPGVYADDFLGETAHEMRPAGGLQAARPPATFYRHSLLAGGSQQAPASPSRLLRSQFTAAGQCEQGCGLHSRHAGGGRTLAADAHNQTASGPVTPLTNRLGEQELNATAQMVFAATCTQP